MTVSAAFEAAEKSAVQVDLQRCAVGVADLGQAEGLLGERDGFDVGGGARQLVA
ncbi:hypothetical protein [Streptomyces guryensis]|uniref:Uncharacterized protein n=1 Tax=Streptomyces guryensis TaxID=2886947 RepID=A0A9Q3ZAM1_9ACTN|nr:hypothetical protein [Streptomyces guryensis]MCD9881023.1 hypothetical protein [Streptomyces guryensis]